MNYDLLNIFNLSPAFSYLPFYLFSYIRYSMTLFEINLNNLFITQGVLGFAPDCLKNIFAFSDKMQVSGPQEVSQGRISMRRIRFSGRT